MKRRIDITLNEQELRILYALIATGLYGRSVSEAVRRLLDKQLEQFVEAPKFLVQKKSGESAHE